MNENINSQDISNANVIRKPGMAETALLTGMFTVVCKDKNGNVKWHDTIKNLITTVGKNLVLDTLLSGSGYSATGPFMGLISSIDWAAVSAGDTMSSHAGWKEAGSTNAPSFSGTRKTCVWSSASGGTKVLSAALVFTMTGSGTVKGCFIVLGTGAVATLMDTNGTLYSCGLFTGGDKTVVDTDILNVSYTASMNG